MSHTVSRKSSLGLNSRRGPQRAHIPYRGDDLEHGKKTGKTVNQVSRDADDFEPFEQVLDQAYRGSVPRPANTRAKMVNGHSLRDQSPLRDNADDSGELSMDIDSTHNSPSSPSVYFNNAAAPLPSSARRIGSSSRPLPRSSTIDYDRVPSPKPAPSQGSSRLGQSSRRSFNTSRLRNEIQDDDGVSRSPVANSGEGPYTPLGISHGRESLGFPDNADIPENGSPSPSSRGNVSFTALAQDVEDDIPEDDQSPVSSRADKGKGHVRDSGDEDSELEEDITAGLQELDDELEDKEHIEPGPSNRKSRSLPPSNSEPPNKSSSKTQSKRVNKQPRISMYETLDEDGLRRSKRRHYPPLEYWRQERVVWGRRENGRSVVPVIKEIIKIPKPPPEPLGGKKRKRSGTHAPRSKSRTVASPNSPVEEVRVVEVDNPELGWDDDTCSNGIILDWYSKAEVERRVAYTAQMISPQSGQANKYSFQKVFGEGNFFAAGQLIIPPGEEKPPKPAKDNSYIFYVIEGAVECKVHRASFVLATGGMFMVPRGNQYYIKNICQREVKIFFAQARKIEENDMEVVPDIVSRASIAPRPHAESRSKSHGASPR